MDRNMRAAIWRDELAHPTSPTTQAAMRLSDANISLVDEWVDLEGHNEPGSDWMVYEDFLKGAIGIAEDHDPKGEFDTPLEHVRRLQHQVTLWEELAKVSNEPHNQVGETLGEKEAYDRVRARAEENKAEHLKAQSMLLRKLSIISIPGKLYARYDVEHNHVVGFGFMPHGSDAGYFGPTAVHEEGVQVWDGPERFWEAVRTYLNNVDEISGEPAMAVVWEEDGWQTCTG